MGGWRPDGSGRSSKLSGIKMAAGGMAILAMLIHGRDACATIACGRGQAGGIFLLEDESIIATDRVE
jgi:hypothetical protein